MSAQNDAGNGGKLTKNTTEIDNWGGDMPERTQNIPLSEIITMLNKSQREKLISGYDLRNFAKIFEDKGAMATVDGFLKNGMNVSLTARKLYMHRNTLIYRLKKIENLTGLDLRNFDMALTFEILRILYVLK